MKAVVVLLAALVGVSQAQAGTCAEVVNRLSEGEVFKVPRFMGDDYLQFQKVRDTWNGAVFSFESSNAPYFGSEENQTSFGSVQVANYGLYCAMKPSKNTYFSDEVSWTISLPNKNGQCGPLAWQYNRSPEAAFVKGGVCIVALTWNPAISVLSASALIPFTAAPVQQ